MSGSVRQGGGAAGTPAGAVELLSRAVAFLFVPGDRPERFEKAARSGADIVIIDLEDAVHAEHKETARANVAEAIAQGLPGGVPFLVRINTTEDQWREADLAAIEAWRSGGGGGSGFAGVVWPKLEPGTALEEATERLRGLAVLGLIESAAGVAACETLAAHPLVTRLGVGAVDLAADLGLSDETGADGSVVAPQDGALVEQLKGRVALASRVAGLAQPVDSPSVELRDADRTRATTARGRALGFGGRLCVHPAQLQPVREAFAPTAAELRWAQGVVEAMRGQGAVAFEGRMLDEPVRLRAERILALAQRASG